MSTDSMADELYAVIAKRVALARLDAQVDLLTEMSRRPTDVDEWTWVTKKLAELKARIDEL